MSVEATPLDEQAQQNTPLDTLPGEQEHPDMDASAEETQVTLFEDEDTLEHGSHDQATHGNRMGKGPDGEPRLVHVGGSGTPVKISTALTAVADDLRKGADAHEQFSQGLNPSKKSAKDAGLREIKDKLEWLTKDKRQMAAMISYAHRTGAHATILPKLQSALDKAQSNSTVYPERVGAIKDTIAAVKSALGTTEAVEQEVLTESIQDAPFNPKPRVATFDVCFLENDAVSLNGRQYPTATVDKLIQSAQLSLSDTNNPPLTCYINHGNAEQDATTQLVGKITKVWREGAKAFASIDIPDTTAGRDVAALVAHRYIITQSLRATGVQQIVDRNRGIPQVVEAPGQTATLQGIDFTSTPGLDKTARIQKVLLESSAPDITEAFDVVSLPSLSISSVQETSMSKESNALPPLASGVSQGVDNSAQQDTYASQNMPVPQVGLADALPNMHESAMDEAHDHLAESLGLGCAPSNKAQEHGKKFAATTEAHLVAAHNALATARGKSCQATPTPASTPATQDDDTDQEDAMEALTPEQARKLLEASGYKVEAPKTQAQLLQEQIDALKAQIAEATTKKAETVVEQAPVAQRQSLVESTTTEPRRAQVYQPTKLPYIRQQLTQEQLVAIADRSQPFPDNVQPERLLKELSVMALASYEHKYGLTDGPSWG